MGEGSTGIGGSVVGGLSLLGLLEAGLDFFFRPISGARVFPEEGTLCLPEGFDFSTASLAGSTETESEVDWPGGSRSADRAGDLAVSEDETGGFIAICHRYDRSLWSLCLSAGLVRFLQAGHKWVWCSSPRQKRHCSWPSESAILFAHVVHRLKGDGEAM